MKNDEMHAEMQLFSTFLSKSDRQTAPKGLTALGMEALQDGSVLRPLRQWPPAGEQQFAGLQTRLRKGGAPQGLTSRLFI